MTDVVDKEKTTRLRICTVKEIVETERAYLQTLNFISTGIHDAMKSSQTEHPEFTDEIIESIVLNSKNLQKLHTSMVAAFDEIVKDGITGDTPVGAVFTKFKNDLRMEYSTYGSNYEHAQTIVSDVMKREPFKGFFQTQLTTLGKAATVANVQGVFLSPVQRVCKYPLLMRELCKHTTQEHPDFENCEHACEVMKEVCSVINEARRRMEKLEEIMDWQAGVEGWEGPNLVDTCNELLKHGTLLKITASKAQERHFFLFDHLLVQCKRMDGKRRRNNRSQASTTASPNTLAATAANTYQFKGSILLDMLEIDEMVERPGFMSNNVHYQFGWRIQDKDKKKAFMCMTQTLEERKEWVEAILYEREKVRAFKLKSLQDSYVLIAARGDRVYKAMRKAGAIKDHKTTVGNKSSDESKCFSGMEFVQYMLESNECASEEDAVEFGCSLVSNGIIHHVSDKCHFKNENFLYRFRYDDGTFSARVEASSLQRKALQFYVRLNLLTTPLIKEVRQTLGANIKNCVTGKDLVDFLVSHNDCSSRDDAVACCDELLNVAMLQHVDGKTSFKDREDMHYRFCSDGEQKEKIEWNNPEGSQVLSQVSECTTRSINIRPKTDTLGFSINSSRPSIITSVVPSGIASIQGLACSANIHTVNGVNIFGADIEHVVNLLRDRSTWLTVTYMTAPTETKALKVERGEKFGFSVSGSQPVSISRVCPDSAASKLGMFPGMAVTQVEDHDMLQSGVSAAMAVLYDKSLDESESDGAKDTKDKASKPVPQIVVDSKKMAQEGTKEEPESEECKMLSWSSDVDRTINITLALPDIIHNVVYNYSTPTGSTVRVTERSIESLFTYSMPAKLYALWASEDAKLAADVQELSESLPMTNPFSSYLLNYHRRLIRHVETYQQCENRFREAHFPSFKGNKDSARIAFAGCPMNCHVYELVVDTKTLSGEALHSTSHSVVCAAPSAVHQMGNCGLQSQITTLESILGLRGMLNKGQKLITSVLVLAEQVGLPPGEDLKGFPSSPLRTSSFVLSASPSCLSLSSVMSTTSEDDPTDESFTDFSALNLNPKPTAQGRAMTFSSEMSTYLGSSVNKAVVNAFLITDGLLNGDAEKRTSIAQFLDPNLNRPQKALTSSISSVNALVKENEKLSTLIQNNEPFEKSLAEVANSTSLLHSEIQNRLMITIAQEDDMNLIQRRDAVFSQVLSSFMSGFVAKLEAAIMGELNPLPEHNADSETMSNRWLYQLADCGIIANYEVIVDPTVDLEMSILEDAVPAVSQLANVAVHLRRWTRRMSEDETSWTKTIVEVTGSRSTMQVTIYMDDCRFEKLPPSLQKTPVHITPCIFSANLYPLPKELMASTEGRRTFLVSCNITSVDKLRDYYKKFRACVLDKSRLPENPEDKMLEIDRLLKPLHTLNEAISALSKTVEFGKGDNVYNSAAVLSLASEITHRYGGIRVSTSQNGHSRNLCSTTLDAAMLLTRCHELPLTGLKRAVDLLRTEGVLLKTMQKNSVKYQFTRDPIPLCSPPSNFMTKRDSDPSQQLSHFKKKTNKSIFRKRTAQH